MTRREQFTAWLRNKAQSDERAAELAEWLGKQSDPERTLTEQLTDAYFRLLVQHGEKGAEDAS